MYYIWLGYKLFGDNKYNIFFCAYNLQKAALKRY